MFENINKLSYERVSDAINKNDQEAIAEFITDVIGDASKREITAFVLANSEIDKRSDIFRAIMHLFSTTLSDVCDCRERIEVIYRIMEVVYIIGAVDAITEHKKGFSGIVTDEYWDDIYNLVS